MSEKEIKDTEIQKAETAEVKETVKTEEIKADAKKAEVPKEKEHLKATMEYKVTWKGWVALLFLIICFSGIFSHSQTPLKALDLMSFLGQFGHAEGAKISLQGTGGFGAREGLAFALTMIPVTMVALGFLEVCQSYGALLAASKLFQPILKFLMGIPGICGLAFVSSFTSSDVGAIMTQDLYKEGLINDDERTIFAAYQYAGSGTINNTIAAGAALVPISLLPVGVIILLIIAVKILGANILRFYLKWYHRRHPDQVFTD